VDQGIYGHLTRRNLAVLATERGDRAEADQLWRAVLAECPVDREALSIIEWLADRQRQANALNKLVDQRL
jgi:hypothetical protein